MSRTKAEMMDSVVDYILDYWRAAVGVILIAVLAAGVYFGMIGSARNVDDIKAHAPKVLDEMGFVIVNYEGFQWGAGGTYGGRAWYNVKRKDDPAGHLYNLLLSKWGNEYQLYNLRCIDCATVQQ